jgi:hypothetical protein
LNSLKYKGVISKEVYDKIRPTSSRPGIIYGLPKIHKDNYPLRRIISAAGTYYYNFAKYLNGLIKPLLTESGYILRDKLDFLNKLSEIKETNASMASFDVELLFTNIPLKETIDRVIELAFEKGSQKTFHGFDEKQLRNLLEE